ncbi:MAG: phosphoribosyltransferase, partial [Bacteroidia bacterium]
MKSLIKLKDLEFVPMISEAELAEKVKEVGAAISEAYQGEEILMMPILKGSFVFAADLARVVTVKQQFRFVLLSTYGDDTTSSGSVKKVQGLEGVDLKGKHVLIIEDIVDTGFSIEFLRKEIAKLGAASVKVVAMLYKPDAFQGEIMPEFYGMAIPNKFVV